MYHYYKFFYYLYFILSSSQNMRKDGYTKNLVGDKGSSLPKPFPSWYKEDIRQGSELSGCLFAVMEQSYQELWKNLRKLGILGKPRAWKKLRHTSIQTVKDPAKKSRDIKRDQTGHRSRITRDKLEIFTNHFGTSLKNVRDVEKEMDPQEWIGDLNLMSRSDTPENQAQENIQGVGIHLCKINRTMGKFQPLQRMDVKNMRGEAASPTTLRRAALSSSCYLCTLSKYVSTVDNICTSVWPQMNL